MATSSSDRSHLIPIFHGTNYRSWKVRMCTYLMSEGLWSIVVSGYDEPEDEKAISDAQLEELEAARLTNAKALTRLQAGVGPTIFPRIILATRAKDAWDILAREFEGDVRTVRVKLQNLRREFQNFRMLESDQIQDFYNKFIDLVNQMRTLGETIPDSAIVQQMLVSLPQRYDVVVAAIEEAKDLDTLKPEELIGSLAANDDRLLRRGDLHSTMPIKSAFQARLNIRDEPRRSSQQQSSKSDNSSEETLFYVGQSDSDFVSASTICDGHNLTKRNDIVVFAGATANDQYQRWSKNFVKGKTDAEGHQAFTLTNGRSGQAMKYAGINQPVQLVTFDPEDDTLLWTSVDSPVVEYTYVRPFNDIRLNLSAGSGNLQEGTATLVAPWNGGARNQLWKMVPSTTSTTSTSSTSSTTTSTSSTTTSTSTTNDNNNKNNNNNINNNNNVSSCFKSK